MRAIQILRRLCATCREEVHVARYEAVMATVEALLRSQKLSVTAMGREASPKSQPRHGIKRVDRLVGNPRMHREIDTWYRALALSLTRGLRRVVVLIDWTQLSNDAWALVATISFKGRSFPVLSRAYSKKRVGNRVVQAAFVRQLRCMLPENCRPVLVADAGFRSTFFDACKSARVDYVIRLRNARGTIKKSSRIDGERIPFAKLFAQAKKEAICLGAAKPYAGSRHSVWGERIVLGPKPPKGNKWQHYADDYERRRGCEPFLLVTSLQNEHAASIVAIYEKRMQIEETFRDTKNPRFGWALSHSNTKSTRRFDVLLLLGALATFVVMLVGAVAQCRGYEPTLRASSTKNRVLSIFTLGNLTLRYKRMEIRLREIRSVITELIRMHRAAFPKLDWPRSRGRLVPRPMDHGMFCADCGWHGLEFGWPP